MSAGPRLVVLAYQEVGFVCLKALLDAGADVRLLLTHEDAPGEEIWWHSAAGLAEERGVPVVSPENPGLPAVMERVREIDPDFIFSFYYRYMLPESFLALARRGAYNLHGSLLPQYRGRVPVNWAVLHGETETGVTLHRMVKKPDAGPIVAARRVDIEETDDVRDVYGKLTAQAARLMADVWPRMAAGDYEETPQDHARASYFGGRRPEDGRIDWQKPAREIYNLVRAVTHPYPGAFTFFNGRRLFVWRAWHDGGNAQGLSPGTLLEESGPGEIAVAAGSGRVLIRAAQWAGGDEVTVSGPEALGLKPGDRFDATDREE